MTFVLAAVVKNIKIAVEKLLKKEKFFAFLSKEGKNFFIQILKGEKEMNQKLFELLEKAKQDKVLKQKLLDTKKEKDPTLAFCELATKEGFPITVGELFAEGEEYISNLLKSVNGGATYPREGWDDPYEMFFASLERI